MTRLKRIRSAMALGVGMTLLFGPPQSFAQTGSEEVEGQHLFILSGQSNMALFQADKLFTPIVRQKFGKEEVIVVKDAKGGEPIRRWYKSWVGDPGSAGPPEGGYGDLYVRLEKMVKEAIGDRKIKTVTFIWMQGESDAEEKLGDYYEASLKGLFDQLRKDLGRDDINFIVGRISDFGLDKRKSAEWVKVRAAQVKVAESTPFSRWVDTDDLNDGLNQRKQVVNNDLHYVGEGFKTLGKRYASAAIELVDERGRKPLEASEGTR